jgi:hypothetical protein
VQNLPIRATSLGIDSKDCGFIAAAKTREDNVVAINSSQTTKIRSLQRGRVDITSEPSTTLIISDIYSGEIEIQTTNPGDAVTLEKADLRSGYVSIDSVGPNLFGVYTTQNGVYYAERYPKDNIFKSKAKKTVSVAASGLILVFLLLFLARQVRMQEKTQTR